MALTTLVAGCKTAPPPAPPESPRVQALKRLGFVPGEAGWELSLGVKLLFETDVDTVTDAGRQAIKDVSASLAQLGIRRIRVEGHTDNVGPARYNAALSLRRALSVARELMSNGWADEAIERIGYGPDKPVADNTSAEGRAQNRRVVITVAAE